MNSATVVGYSFDADTHCVTCTKMVYGAEPEFHRDGEDNPIHPIFAGEEFDTQPVCRWCLAPISVSVIEYLIAED